ncbi:DUF2723 domain-containing protein [Flavobacterium terrigena]|uniref:DUF2723 domain-containing protein n=1 Tax=Flavobacterium terrigena TaxID=402734 RepID=A0A1H6VF20_9FLAO|nr:DUF2723 domain-containing protein [Flavobacterium terrigena]SEJ00407.1 Protein of unknown function [Flavobacterium terrigena]
MTSFNYSKWNTYTGWFAFIIALVTYTLTVEPTMSFWDCGEYIATAAKLEVGHPPGAPLYQMMGAFFAMFATDNTQIALMINMMSVFSSAFTILFMYWSLSKIIRKVVKATSEWNDETSKLTLGASLVAALSYTFTDSFWFNAVEAEVYSMASLFIALLFWLGLKWEEELETERGNKWLILISLVIGLSFGVHFMALLTLPSIGMLYFFKKQKNVTTKNFIIANVVILAILMFIFKFLLPYTLSFFAKTEIFAVNSMGLPFNSGTIIAFILIVTGFYFGLSYTKKKGLVEYNTLLLCVLFILIGFSTWIMLPVRANSNININENKPSDAAEVLAYYNREQYGETKLFYGPQFSNVYAGADEEDPYSDDKPNYERDEKTGKYIITNNYKDANHNPNSKHNAFLPRLWSEEHAKNYMTFTKPLEFSINHDAFYDEETGETNEDKLGQFTEIVSDFRSQFASNKLGLDEYEEFLKTYGDYLTIEKPSFSDNMKFMFEYQFGYMYFRYLMWNFVGRQNDLQGNYESLEGNWLSGIGFIDNLHLDNQSELSTDMKNNKGRNTYFFLPFILAVIGMVYHAKKEWKSFYVLLLLFLFTGLVLKVYLNERPFEPRERDYALVGSFYIFAMWIGVGIYAIYQYILKYVNPKVALPVVLATTLLASPVVLASQNWDDHDRSCKHTAVAMARAYLDSCEPNAILFTIGDNDTFPMWYLQEIEGYRTDVRIVNTSLLATDWYIDEMKVKSNKSDALPISFTHDQYVGDKRNYCLFDERTTDTLDLGLTLDFLKDDRSKREMKNGQFVHFYPSEHLKIKVDKQNIIKNKVVSPKYYDSIVPQINLKLKGGAIYKNRILMLDIFNENNWKRPIYFSPGSFGSDDYIWMKEYLQLDGMVYKLVPIRTKLQEGNSYDMGYIDTDKMYNIINKWTWGNAGSDKIYHDPETRKNALSYRNNLSRLMTALIEEKKFDKAEKVIQIAMKNMPIDYFEYYTTVNPFAEGYYKIGKPAEARKIITQLIKKHQEKITFFDSQSEKQKAFYGREINDEIKRYYMLMLIAEENNDLEFYNQQIIKFKNYNKMMGDYGISIE